MNDKLVHTSSTLLMRHIFGMNCDIRQESQLFDSKLILYSAGQYLVKLNMDEQSQEFTNGFPFMSQITAISLSTKRSFVAIAKKGEKLAIHLHETNLLKKKKMIAGSLPDAISTDVKEYNYLSFCLEDERLLSLSNKDGNRDTEPIIILWDLQTNQISLMAFYKTHSDNPYTECMFSPTSNNILSLCGGSEFRLFKFQEDELRVTTTTISYKNYKPKDIVCHIWLHQPNIEIVIVCLDKMILFVNEIGNCTGVYDNKKALTNPTCIERFTGGFFLADGLKIHIFKPSADTGEYTIYETLELFNGIGDLNSDYNDDLKESWIKNIHIDFATEEKLVAITDKRNIYSADLPNEEEDTDLIPKRGIFSLVSDPVHSNEITSMDICKRKPYVATSSLDQTVKVWDYERRELVFLYSFPEEVHAIAFHPSGLHIAVAFSDKIQFIKLYLRKAEQTRRVWKDIMVKNCKCMSFSNGGGYLAVASGLTNQSIQIFPLYYSPLNATSRLLKGHVGQITSLTWEKNDLSLYSCGSNGLIYCWSMRDETSREDIIQTKGPVINDFVLSPNSTAQEHHFYCVFESEESLMEHSGTGKSNPADKSPVYSTVAITNNNKMIFTGVKDKSNTGQSGSIMYYRTHNSVYQDFYYAHDYRGVQKLLITHDDKFLISCGVDGTIIMFDIKDKEAARGGGILHDEFKQPCNNILVTSREIEELYAQKENLEALLAEEQNSNSSNIDIGVGLEKNIQNLDEEIKREEEGNSKKQKEALLAKNQKRQAKQAELDEVTAECEKQLKELEVWMTMKLTEKQENFKDLTRQTTEARKLAQEKLEEVQDKHRSAMEKELREYENKLQKEVEAKKRLQQDIETIKNKNEATLELIKTEIHNEKEDLEAKYREEVKNLRNNTIKLKNSAHSFQKKKEKHVEAIEAQKEKHEEEKKKLTQLEMNVKKLKGENRNLELTLKEKNNTIINKEKRIYELKRKTQELEKFKYVLDFKIKELKCDIVPREKEIGRLKEKIIFMDNRLKDYNANNNLLGHVVEDLEKEQEKLQKRIQHQKLTLRTQKAGVRLFKNSLYDAVQHILDYETLKEKLIKLNKGKVRKAEINNDIFREYQSQLRFLEKSVNEFKQDLDKDSEIHKQDGMRIMMTNVALIKEITDLREAIKIANKTENPHSQIKRIMQSHGENYSETTVINCLKIRQEQETEIEKLRGDLSILEGIYGETPSEIQLIITNSWLTIHPKLNLLWTQRPTHIRPQLISF